MSGASVLLVSGLASAQCSKDTDCKGDRVCEAGKCTSPVLPPAPPAPPGSPAPGTPSTGAPVAPEAGAAPAEGQAPLAPTTGALAAGPAVAPAAVTLDGEPPSNTAPAGATSPLPEDEPTTLRRSRTAMISGIVMVSVGPIALLGALAAKNAQEKCDTALERDYPDHRLPPSEGYREEACNDYSVPLYLFGIGGAVLTATGIPLIVYGAKRVPAPPRASLRVMPWASLDSGGLRLRLDL